MLRGNHESSEINGDARYRDTSLIFQCQRIYGEVEGFTIQLFFLKAVKATRFGLNSTSSLSVCHWLPLLTVKYFVCTVAFLETWQHAIFKFYQKLQKYLQLLTTFFTRNKIERPVSVLQSQFIFDLLWSDPATQEEETHSIGTYSPLPETNFFR